MADSVACRDDGGLPSVGIFGPIKPCARRWALTVGGHNMQAGLRVVLMRASCVTSSDGSVVNGVSLAVVGGPSPLSNPG